MLALSMLLCTAVVDAIAQSTTAAPPQQTDLDRQKLEAEILNMKAREVAGGAQGG